MARRDGRPRHSGPASPALATIDLSGPGRCLFASNFPVDRLASSNDAIWQAFDEITAGLSEGERRKLFMAMRRIFYRLGRA